jgi:hypothetical protein
MLLVREGRLYQNSTKEQGVPLASLGSALLPVSATGLGPPRPYAAVSRYTAPRVVRRNVSRGAALDNQRRVRAASRFSATS